MVRLTDRPDMTLDVYRGCKTTIQQERSSGFSKTISLFLFGFIRNDMSILHNHLNLKKIFMVLL